ncbi:MAG: N-acetylmuramoyl-L-alanine amidase [Proteobacteria bacterium]|nr:N-acetylmuramoyl-L-alanine amidase [Pseudomonadota bacterium]
MGRCNRRLVQTAVLAALTLSAAPLLDARGVTSACAAPSRPERAIVAQAPSDTDVEFENVPSSPSPTPRNPTPEEGPVVDLTRARDLVTWKPAITAYSKRHYGEETWVLRPTCIVLHFTAGREWPWNLVKSDSFADEAPGLASHYVIDGASIWQLLPLDVRSRGAYGINHRAINIEMVAADAADLAQRPQTLRACADLVRWLTARFGIPKTKIYAHAAVSRMNPREIPEVFDRVNSQPYGKPDPGEQNMRSILEML